jgi:hypothetical protein
MVRARNTLVAPSERAFEVVLGILLLFLIIFSEEAVGCKTTNGVPTN